MARIPGTMLLSAAALVGEGIAGPALRVEPTPAIAFVDVAVIPMTEDRVRQHQTVIVQDGVVSAIGALASVAVPAGARVIDGRGRFLMPGLTDAHVHLMEAADLPGFLAYGVTTVRNLMGSPEILGWRNAVASGALPGPRIVTSGPLLAGPAVPWRSKVVPTDAATARDEVRRQHEAGYDLIKVYDGLTAEVYQAIVAEARRLGMRVTGHIPADVHLAGVLGAGQDLEHLDKLVFDVWGHDFDSTRIDSVAGAVRRAGVVVTPTIASMEQLARVGSGRFDSLLARPGTERVGAGTLAFWCDVTSRLRGNRAPGPGVRFNPWTDFQLKLLAGLHRAGVPLLAGTDSPNAVLPAGGGLLDEIEALRDAGLSPFEALGAATIAPARAMGDSTSGFIARGARADLVLLGANPLEDLEALRTLEGVMGAGRWFPRDELDRLAPKRAAVTGCSR